VTCKTRQTIIDVLNQSTKHNALGKAIFMGRQNRNNGRGEEEKGGDSSASELPA
jgi:hypothetical protein